MADEEAYKLRSFITFLQTLGAGQFHRELTDTLEEINATLNNVAQSNGSAKGKLSISIDFSLKGGRFEVNQNFSVKLPAEKLPSTILWSTPDNKFTAANPKQVEMFGRGPVRDVGGDGAVTTV